VKPPSGFRWSRAVVLVTAVAQALPSAAAEEEWRRSKPDVIVYLPKGVEHNDGHNEMFMVTPSGKSDELLGMWTQSSVEGRGRVAALGGGHVWKSRPRAGLVLGHRIRAREAASWGRCGCSRASAAKQC